MNRPERDSCGFGLLVDMHNRKSCVLIKTALTALARLSHRGAVGEDGLSGDGCGLMLQVDHAFFRQRAKAIGIKLSDHFALGMCFLNPEQVHENRIQLEFALQSQGFRVAGWRAVPVDLRYIGKNQTIPAIQQVFVEFSREWSADLVEKKLYIAKIQALDALRAEPHFSIASLSSQTLVYKALALPKNLPLFYPDLQEESLVSAVALVHQRFSTNTLSSWNLAQPFSTLAHNGEINTIQGNRHFAEQISPGLIKKYFPELQGIQSLVNNKGSDSQSMDNLLETFIHTGLPVYEALRLMIPPAWENNNQMRTTEKDYYAFHAPLLPPWEGPAGLIFFDGRFAGCILDRNGFRPARLIKSDQQWLGIGSEAGIFDLEDQNIIELSRLKPGELLIIDLEKGDFIKPEAYIQKHPYASWVKTSALHLPDTESRALLESFSSVTPETCKRFDLSFEEKEDVLRYMAENALESTSSMGDDTPLAAMSSRPRQLFDFFRQQFAQVTNPAIDSLREKSVMSLQTTLGSGGIISERKAGFAKKIHLKSPLLTRLQLQALNTIEKADYHYQEISLAFPPQIPLKTALENLVSQCLGLLEKRHNLLVLSDEIFTEQEALIHPALAVGALHHGLIKKQKRQKVSIIVNSGWIREAHHAAMLIASGADAFCPWLGYQIIRDTLNTTVSRKGSTELSELQKMPENQDDCMEALSNYRSALNKGLLKICSKMGVCTIGSYRGSQLFHLIGFDREIINDCFSQCSYWFEKYDWQALDLQQKTFYQKSIDSTEPLRQGGLFKYAPQGEYHDYNPDVVTALLRAVREGDSRYYQHFKTLVNHRKPSMVRDFLQIKADTKAIKLTEVEDAFAIIKRFDTAAMSLGALSPEAHEALAVAMNTLGGRSNSGEGGEDFRRQKTIRQSRIKQIASARFGVTAEYLMHAEVIQIKISQGAKPGEGGQLSGAKVNTMIAELRYCSPGATLISPPPHHDIYSIEDLAQLIFDLKQINPEAFISVKLVSSPGIGTIAAGVVKAYADMITISGYDGGTGASPLSSIRYTGCPWEFGISETQAVLIENNLRHRVTLQVDGGLKTGLDVIKAAILGAESFGFGTAPMIALGCKYLRICHLNNCATGLATQDETLRKAHFHGKHAQVIQYFLWVAEEVREILAELGFRHLKDIIGRVDLLQPLKGCEKQFASMLDNPLPLEQYREKLYLCMLNPPVDKALLAKKIRNDVLSAIENQHDFYGKYSIANHDRSLGANIAGEIAFRYNQQSFKGQIHLDFKGIAGQSFGAWLVQGLTFHLDGAANDYVAKGMSGGELVIKSGKHQHRATLAGNTCLYGATGGRCFIDGCAGERFAVRNSGAEAVVVNTGNHACEYMTGGIVVVLSTPGDNFAAGMTGGMAFVYDDQQKMEVRCNQETVNIYPLNHPELCHYEEKLMALLKCFHHKTESIPAMRLLENRPEYLSKLVLILPKGIDPYVHPNIPSSP